MQIWAQFWRRNQSTPSVQKLWNKNQTSKNNIFFCEVLLFQGTMNKCLEILHSLFIFQQGIRLFQKSQTQMPNYLRWPKKVMNQELNNICIGEQAVNRDLWAVLCCSPQCDNGVPWSDFTLIRKAVWTHWCASSFGTNQKNGELPLKGKRTDLFYFSGVRSLVQQRI